MDNGEKTAAQDSKTKVPIGALMVANDMILPQDLTFALDHQKYSKRLLGEILLNMGALENDDLDKALDMQDKGLILK